MNESWKKRRATYGRRNPETGARNNCNICHGTGRRKHLQDDGSYKTTWCGCHVTNDELRAQHGRDMLYRRGDNHEI